jgi:hypothetical protein
MAIPFTSTSTLNSIPQIENFVFDNIENYITSLQKEYQKNPAQRFSRILSNVGHNVYFLPKETFLSYLLNTDIELTAYLNKGFCLLTPINLKDFIGRMYEVNYYPRGVRLAQKNLNILGHIFIVDKEDLYKDNTFSLLLERSLHSFDKGLLQVNTTAKKTLVELSKGLFILSTTTTDKQALIINNNIQD